MQQLKSDILNCLQQLKGSGKFATTHSVEFIMPGLQVDSVGTIAFPLTETQAKALIHTAKPAPFGKGNQTIIDATVRSTHEIDAANVHFSNPKWEPFLAQCIKI